MTMTIERGGGEAGGGGRTVGGRGNRLTGTTLRREANSDHD